MVKMIMEYWLVYHHIFYKFVVVLVRIEAIAFTLPNRKLKSKDLLKYLTSVD